MGVRAGKGGVGGRASGRRGETTCDKMSHKTKNARRIGTKATPASSKKLAVAVTLTEELSEAVPVAKRSREGRGEERGGEKGKGGQNNPIRGVGTRPWSGDSGSVVSQTSLRTPGAIGRRLGVQEVVEEEGRGEGERDANFGYNDSDSDYESEAFRSLSFPAQALLLPSALRVRHRVATFQSALAPIHEAIHASQSSDCDRVSGFQEEADDEGSGDDEESSCVRLPEPVRRRLPRNTQTKAPTYADTPSIVTSMESDENSVEVRAPPKRARAYVTGQKRPRKAIRMETKLDNVEDEVDEEQERMRRYFEDVDNFPIEVEVRPIEPPQAAASISSLPFSVGYLSVHSAMSVASRPRVDWQYESPDRDNMHS